MKLTVIGATGGIGRSILEQAVAAGHDVTAVARDPSRVADGVRTAGVDLGAVSGQAAADLEAAVAGADAVLSGLGARHRSDAGVVAQGTRALIRAMRDAGARRLLVVSAAPVAAFRTPPQPDPGQGAILRHLAYPVLTRVLRGVYVDLGRTEDDLAASGLDWTAVRPPRLTNGPLTGTYRTAVDQSVRAGYTISRPDVAHLMLDLAGRPESAGHAVGCGY
ncbi:NAD(P)H-binding protein [Kineosporia sp. J2-2]|uniref:NAD(P)H-binding protein n=1 Tax=Kineosporia corallincola TaxID=2835133 RepID=A0ABS5TDG5_9ACTN|nr:NAD(P)H-binding protein [Kineosporia corallincola]MBT0769132.1 NAD(P)H-binding protein [Kineosporia corallincola]